MESIVFFKDELAREYNTTLITAHKKLLLKLDTGASHTILSMGNLARKGSHVTFTERNKAGVFKSAFGEKRQLYKACIHDIVLGGIKFSKLYFYTANDLEEDKALLGFDFVDCCNMWKTVHSNIRTTVFDWDAYNRSHRDSLNYLDVMCVDEVLVPYDDYMRAR